MGYIAWHFLNKDRRLRWGSKEVVEEGRTYRCEFPYDGCDAPSLCYAGMHGSFRAIDGLGHAPGSIVCLTEIGGNVVIGDDKLVGEWRRVLRMADASTLLFEFACDVAEQAMKDRQAEGYKFEQASFDAVEVRRKWVRGEATDRELSAAKSAAWAAARPAVGSAVGSAAMSAAESAAWLAPESVAESAAWSAARSAAWAVADAEAMSAAELAAWSAAKSAAESAQNEILEARLRKLLGY